VLGPSNLFLQNSFALSLSHCVPTPAILGTAVEIPTKGDWTSTAYILLEYPLRVLVALPCKSLCTHMFCCNQQKKEVRYRSFNKGYKFLVREYSSTTFTTRTSHALVDPFCPLIIFFVARLYFCIYIWLMFCSCAWVFLISFFFSVKLCVALQLFHIPSVILAEKAAVTFRNNAASLSTHSS